MNDGRTTACEYDVFPHIYNPPSWDDREDNTTYIVVCPGGQACLPRMKGGIAAPIVRHDGRQVIKSVCKAETTTTTTTTTTTKGPAMLFTPAPDSALGKFVAERDNKDDYIADPVAVMLLWAADQARTIAELEARPF